MLSVQRPTEFCVVTHSGLTFLYELCDGPEGDSTRGGKLLYLQAVHTQEEWAEIRSKDCQ